MGHTQSKSIAPVETHLKVLQYTEPTPIEDNVWRCIALQTNKDYLTVSELATFLNALLDEHPEFTDVALNSAEDEWGTRVDVKPNGLTIT